MTKLQEENGQINGEKKLKEEISKQTHERDTAKYYLQIVAGHFPDDVMVSHTKRPKTP